MAKLIEFPHPALTGSYVPEKPAEVVLLTPPEPQWRYAMALLRNWGITVEEIPDGAA